MQGFKMQYEKFIFNGQMQTELFFIVIYHSSLVKAAVRICKLHSGVKKTPQFLLFSMAKG
jgi:hypothetical protein